MVLDAEGEIPDWVEGVSVWRQGDYTLDLSQMLLAKEIDEGGLIPVAGEVLGVVVISQTCDIVNCRDDREWVVVAALVEVAEDTMENIGRGTSPRWASLEFPPQPTVAADLSQMMTIHKSVLAKCERKEGFRSDLERGRFADVLSRKHGRFAFPDAFSEGVLAPLRNRLRDAHKKNSDQGRTYRSIKLIRAAASPDWDAETVRVGFRFVLESTEKREADRAVIAQTIQKHLNSIDWPAGFQPQDPPFVVQEMAEMTAQDWVDSQEVDLQFISIAAAG
jgi:hypothetical protein